VREIISVYLSVLFAARKAGQITTKLDMDVACYGMEVSSDSHSSYQN
jgi:hypothetical protein